MAGRRNWTEQEYLAALVLYLTVPSGRHDSRNPRVRELAEAMGRTSGSVVMRLANFRACDPNAGTVGLTHISQGDAALWERYLSDPEGTVEAAVGAFDAVMGSAGLDGESSVEDVLVADDLVLPQITTREAVVSQRVNQSYFRNALLDNYGERCCVTGISVPSLLVASHIKPWAASEGPEERLTAANGLLLNALHDRAFDQGYLTLDFDGRMRVSSKPPHGGGNDILWRCDGLAVARPKRLPPAREFVEYHQDVVFKG